MKQDNPFAKLGALDQKLYQETSTEKSVVGNAGNPEIQKSRNIVPQKTIIPETQYSGKQEVQNAGNPEIQNNTKREFYTKGTYRLCDEALDAIEDSKRILERQYGLKVNMEEIVEAAILEVYDDLNKNKQQSHLVKRHSGIPQLQKF
jgi:hypothetical protein